MEQVVHALQQQQGVGIVRGEDPREADLALAGLIPASIVVMLSAACGSPPTIQPSPVIEDPAISCPATISVTAHAGANPKVAYDVPLASKGLPPVTVICTPGPGSEFKNGVTTVTCEATDVRGRKGLCSFTVVVTPVPQVLKTKFMAFGDSITEGVSKLLESAIVQVPPKHFNAANSYPELLNARLTARYQDQAITMVASGWGGELAEEGTLRLQDEWGVFNPEVLLLLEGTNDITAPSAKTVQGMNDAMDNTISALRFDIGFAKSRGTRVFLGTLTPLAPPVTPSAIAAVPVLNTRIRALAEEQSVTLVNINGVVPASMLSVDGIHPKAGSEAYSLMADEWLKAIIATLEVKPSSLH